MTFYDFLTGMSSIIFQIWRWAMHKGFQCSCHTGDVQSCTVSIDLKKANMRILHTFPQTAEIETTNIWISSMEQDNSETTKTYFIPIASTGISASPFPTVS